MKPDDKLYGLDSQERLDSQLEDVIEKLIDDNCVQAGESFDAIADRIEWPVEVHVFERMKLDPPERIADRILSLTLEDLDEQFADPDGDPAEPSQAIVDAALALAKAIVDDYAVWACQPTGEVIKVTREQAKERDYA